MLISNVKAIRLDEHGGPEVLKLVTVDVPDPAANEVTIRQKAVGLNFIDIYFRTGCTPVRCLMGWATRGRGSLRLWVPVLPI